MACSKRGDLPDWLALPAQVQDAIAERLETADRRGPWVEGSWVHAAAANAALSPLPFALPVLQNPPGSHVPRSSLGIRALVPPWWHDARDRCTSTCAASRMAVQGPR